MTDTTFTSQADYSAALAEHTAAGGTVDAFEAINGTHYAEKPLAPTKDQQETGQGGLSPAEWAAEKASFLAQGGSLETWNQIIGQDAATAEINGSLDDNVADTIAALMAAGKSEEEINAIFAEHGIELTGQVQDDRTEGQREFDRLSNVPDSPTGYKLDWQGRVGEGVDLHAVNAEWTQLAYDLAVPADVAPSLIGQAVDAGQALTRLSPAAQELRVREGAAAILRHFRGDEAAAAQANATVADLLANATDQRTANALRVAIADPQTFLLLFNHASYLLAREEL